MHLLVLFQAANWLIFNRHIICKERIYEKNYLSIHRCCVPHIFM